MFTVAYLLYKEAAALDFLYFALQVLRVRYSFVDELFLDVRILSAL